MMIKGQSNKYSLFSVLVLLLLPIILENSQDSVLTNDLNEKTIQSNDKLDFAFLLHANQANVPYADVANDICYHQVLETMLQYPTLHFPLHFSGSLLTELAWHNQSTLNLLRQGINSGQFEIIGSTYAQNIIYSHADDYDNELQIDAHKKTISNILGVEPTGFWNPERCWNQERYVPLITEGGYSYTFVEDVILADSAEIIGNDEFLVKKTSYDDNELLVFNDDKTAISFVDTIAFITEASTDSAVVTAVDNLIDYLQSIYLDDVNDDYCVVYGQDMEVWGLWQVEGRPLDTLENVFSRLDYLFERLQAESSWLNVCTTQEFLDTLNPDYQFFEIPSIVNGSGGWMEIPSINAGYDNWFDFSANDSRINDYRTQFKVTRDRLKEIDQEIISKKATQDVTAAENLLSYAKMVFVANQFEFGCIGCYFPWYYRTKSSLLTAEAAHYSLYPSSANELLAQDWDHDGNLDFILRNDKILAIITGQGARLINVFDIENGEIILANDIPATYATYSVNGLDYTGGTPLSSYVETVTGDDLWGRTSNSYRIRPKTFADGFNDYNGNIYDWYWKNSNRTAIIAGDNPIISFTQSITEREITKTFSIEDNKIIIDYSINNTGNTAFQPEISLSLSPGNEKILYYGKDALNHEIITEADKIVLNVTNILTKTTVLIEGEESEITFDKDEIDPQFAIGYLMKLIYVQPETTNYYRFTLQVDTEIDDIESSDTNFSDKTSNTTNSPLLFSLLPVITSIVLVRRKLTK